MNLIIDDCIYLYLKDNDYQSLSAFPDNFFKKAIDWRIQKEQQDLFIINWGENLHGTDHAIMETGFFFDGIHLDKHGLYNFASFNLIDSHEKITNYTAKITAQELFQQGKLHQKFRQPKDILDWTGIVLMCQHPTDRSILKAGTTRQYYDFIEDACKYYGANLFLKIHPVNSKEEEEKLGLIAKKYGSSWGRVNTDIIRNCQHVLVYNSTVVVDCLLRNIPVVHYAPGYFWKSGTVTYSDRQFVEPKNNNIEYNQKFCDFLIWKYCFHRKYPMDIFNKIFHSFYQSKELFPLPEEFSYANYILNS